MRRLTVRLGLLALAAATLAGPRSTAGAVAGVPPEPTGPDDAVRVIVWDAADRGTDVWAAGLDGSERRRLYRRAPGQGSVDNLTLSRDGRQVALNVTAGRSGAGLVTVATDGSGRATDLLRGHDEVVGVGVLDWSPDGRRLAFAGFVDEPGAGSYHPSYLFTVRADGTGLRRHGRLGDGRGNGAVFGAMAWTEAGIVCPTDDRLLLIDGPRRRTIARHADDVRPSGDRAWVYFTRIRPSGSRVLWRVRPDGTGAEQVAAASAELGELFGPVPDRDGTHVLTTRRNAHGTGTQVVSFPVAAPDQVSRVPVDGRISAITWR